MNILLHKRLWSMALPLALLALVLTLMSTTGRTSAHVGETFILDQEQPNSVQTLGTIFFGQSFTAGLTGDLAKISIGMGGNPATHSGILNIYSGGIDLITKVPPISSPDGEINGALLHSQSISWNDVGTTVVLTPFVITSHVAVIAGQEYTWEIIHADPNVTIQQSVFGSRDIFAYAHGRSLLDSLFDHHFQTFIADIPPEVSKKVDVCHKTHSKKNPQKTINISINALEAHLAHGDTEGPC